MVQFQEQNRRKAAHVPSRPQAVAKDTCAFPESGPACHVFQDMAALSPFKILRRQNGPFSPNPPIAANFAAECVKNARDTLVSLALFACSATKCVSRHDQSVTDDTPQVPLRFSPDRKTKSIRRNRSIFMQAGISLARPAVVHFRPASPPDNPHNPPVLSRPR